jgi:1,4-dihydroxy-2-naphthoyl-CoA hydrolase
MMRSLGRADAVTGASLGAMSDIEETTAEALARFDLGGTLLERMGIEITEAGPQRTAGTMPVAGNTQPAGLLHGGASVVLAESLGSIAATLHAGAGRTAVGIEINATHHRAMRDGVVVGVATAVHLGRSVATYEIVITDDRDRRVCTSRLTCMLVDAR